MVEPDSIVDALQALGLTALEADAYVALVRCPGITGYGIAKELRKPTANVYKALAGLTAKGAAITEEGGERRYTAVPPEELVRRFELAAKRAGRTILDRLKDVTPRSTADAIYSLHTRDQAEERIGSILRDATNVLVVDASPGTLEQWAPELEAVAARGTSVLIKAYAPRAVPGCSVFVDPRGEEIQRRWRAQWFHVVGDGVEALLSIYADGALARGLWTREPLLTVVYHEALVSELLLAGLARLIGEGEAHRPLRELLAGHLGAIRLDTRGFDHLFSRFEAARDET